MPEPGHKLLPVSIILNFQQAAGNLNDGWKGGPGGILDSGGIYCSFVKCNRSTDLQRNGAIHVKEAEKIWNAVL